MARFIIISLKEEEEMRRIKKFSAFLLFLIITLGSVPLWAGITGKISGRVTDSQTGEPLPGVNMIVEGTTLGAATDLKGYFVILNVRPGVYTLKASMMGYKPTEVKNLRVSIDLTTEVDFKLESTVLEIGKVITVVAERRIIRPDLTSSTAIVTSEQIANIPAEEFRDILQLQAGITVGGFGETHIRGGRSNEVAYWIDGVSVTDAYDCGLAVEVENAAIQELQVVSGTFNAEYGQAMSGVVNIVTKEGGEKYSGKLSAYSGDYLSNHKETFLDIDKVDPLAMKNIQGSLSGPLPFFRNKLSFYATGRYFYNDGWLYGQRKFTPFRKKGDYKIIPMNYRRKVSSQLKLTWRLSPSIRLSYGYMWDRTKYRDYDHYFRYNPDGDFKRFRKGYNHLFSLTHTLSSKAFYTLNISKFFSDYRHYVYKDPLDSLYVHPDSMTAPPYNFASGGTKMQHFHRNTTTTVGKFDLTSQVTSTHQVRSGVEMRFHKLYLHDFEIIPKRDESGEITPFQPTIPPITAPNHNQYTHRPKEFSAYIQDKIEYKDMIINAGLRYDYFQPDGKVLRDPQDPNIHYPFKPEHHDSVMSLAEREKIWYKDAKPKMQLSPRIGIAYPITDRGVIHFSYGHFLQIPPFEYLYANSEFEVPRTTGVSTIIGNADLDVQRTVMYEIGLQQQLSDNIGADVTLFYRDIRNWVGTSPEINTAIPGTKYSKYINREYANVRGITLSLNKRPSNYVSATVDYTFQIAEGTASNPQDAFNDARAGREPRKQVIPLAWDQRHTFNASVILGTDIWSIGLIGRYSTGLPYTPRVIQGVQVGRTLSVGLRENSERRPDKFSIDLRTHKDFSLSGFCFSIFANIYNLLDTKNENGVFEDTGTATYTLEQRVAGADAAKDYFVRPDFYSEPRQVQIGLSVSF